VVGEEADDDAGARGWPVRPGREAVGEHDSGQLELRYASLSDTDTRLAVTLRAEPAPRRRGRHDGAGPLVGGPPVLTLTDDRGTAVSAGFSGGGAGDEWRGHYRADQPLSPQTRWIDLLGERVELLDETQELPVEIEPLDNTDPVQRYLQHCLEGLGERRPRAWSVDDAIEALVACGVLEPTAAVIDKTLAVADALRPMHRAPTAGSYALPQRWSALLAARGRGGGPTGTLVVGARTPVFDGVSAAVLELESTDTNFQIEVEIAGAVALATPFADDVQRVGITYSATDDRGNPYLGDLAGWSSNDDGIQGQVEFWPALDPMATRLDLALTADRARAVIRIPLSWSEPA